MIDHAIVIAVGNAAHQSKLIYTRPRTMLPALDKPLVVRVLDRLRRTGITHFTVIVGEQEGSIAAYLDSHWVATASVDMVIQSNQNTLAQTLSEIARQHTAPFLLTSYNSFTHLNFAERLCRRFLSDPTAALLMSGAEASLSWNPPTRYVTTENNRVTALTKTAQPGAFNLMDFSLCGTAFIDYLAALPETAEGMLCKDLVSVYEHYLARGGTATLVPTSWSLQIEDDLDLLTLSNHLLDEEQDAHILSEIPSSVQIIPPVRIDPSVSVGQNAHIGPYVYLESGCSVGDGALIENAMILNRVAVRAGETIIDSIVATRARIHA